MFRRFALLPFLLVLLAGMTGCTPTESANSTDAPDAADAETAIDPALLERAQDLTQRFIIVDGHIDVPYRMMEFEEDITQATEGGDTKSRG